MKALLLTPARRARRRGSGGAGRNSLPARENKNMGVPAKRNALWGVSDQRSLKTVWGVGYKFEVVSPA